MKLSTTRFGMIEVLEDQVIQMPHGMIGFPEWKRFVLLRHSEASPFFWLQSVDNGGMAFVLTDPLWFQPDYDIEISPEDSESLKLDLASEGIQTLVIVNIHLSNGKPEITANLLGPIVINPHTRLAKQIVLHNCPYSHRHPVPMHENKNP